jgi:hypothetical protein
MIAKFISSKSGITKNKMNCTHIFLVVLLNQPSEYKPLPVEIYEDYADGVRIIDEMILLGKFEKIDLSKETYIGAVVTNGNKFLET